MESFLLFYHTHPIEVIVTPLTTLHDTRYVIQLPTSGFVLRQTGNGSLDVQGAPPTPISTELLEEVKKLVREKYDIVVASTSSEFAISIEVTDAPIQLRVIETKLSNTTTQFSVIARNKTLILESKIVAGAIEWQLKEGTVHNTLGLQKIVDVLEAKMNIKV